MPHYANSEPPDPSLLEAIRSLSPRCGHTTVVAIDGCGGAGKSTLAAALAREFPESGIIHTDDFASWDVPLDWWPRLLDQVLIPLSQGKPARYQRSDWGTRTLAEWHDFSAPILLLEGVSSSRREFRPYLSYAIWVDCPAEVRLARGLARDGDAMLDQWLAWMAAEDTYVAQHQPLEHANWVVRNGFVPTSEP
ncbi:MAG: uridine kinase family protein [Fimbriimonas sp.]